MIKAIEIHGNDSDTLSVESEELLNCILDGDKNIWSILWLEAMGHKDGKSVLQIEEDVKSSKDGIILDWAELKEALSKFDQIIELIIIGDKDKVNLRRYENENEMYSNCYYTIELVDSSYWVIHSKNERSINMMKMNLAGAKFVL